jgi:hypothetical protein
VPSGKTVQYEWFLDNVLLTGKNQSQVSLTAPATSSTSVLKCKISSDGKTAEDTLHLQVVAHIATPPVVNGIQSATKFTVKNESNTFTALVTAAPGEVLTYNWSTSTGILNQTETNSVSWQAPNTPSVGTITVEVTNQDLLSTTVSAGLLVKDTSLANETPLIYYPLDFDTRNISSDRFHATASGVTKTEDSRGLAELAYKFTSGSNIIFTENHADLNFTNAVSMSCWLKCEELGSERFIISHGSWQQRYKISITPEGKLRWTIKTSTGVADLDGSVPIELNKYYHVTVLYTGYSMELYLDGILNSFKAFTGTIQPSTKPLTIGRMDNVETLYSLRGSVDEVKLWDKEIPIRQIEKLKDQWNTSFGIEEENVVARIYPNPAKELIYVEFAHSTDAEHVSLFNADGREVKDYKVKVQDSRIEIDVSKASCGLHLLRIVLKDGKVLTRKIMIL